MKSENNNPQKSQSVPNGGKRVIRAPVKAKPETEKKLPEHDNLAQNLVLGEDSGPMLTTSEMLDFSQGADS